MVPGRSAYCQCYRACVLEERLTQSRRPKGLGYCSATQASPPRLWVMKICASPSEVVSAPPLNGVGVPCTPFTFWRRLTAFLLIFCALLLCQYHHGRKVGLAHRWSDAKARSVSSKLESVRGHLPNMISITNKNGKQALQQRKITTRSGQCSCW